MRRRPSARLLVVDKAGRVLLFHFVFKTGLLANKGFWATPGGAVEPGETFEQAAIRELEEETGFRTKDIGPQIAAKEFELQLSDGELVLAVERFFLIKADCETLSKDGWTVEEMDVIAEHRWWTQDELAQSSESIWPKDILDILRGAVGR